MSFLYTNAQVRELEALTIAEERDTEYGLIKKAGQAGLNCLKAHWPDARHVAVVCGKGSNAADGFMLALLAHQEGLLVSLITVMDAEQLKGTALWAFEAATAAGLIVERYHAEMLFSADVIVDALLGSGLNRLLEPPYSTCVEAINAAEKPVLSLDVPSGIQADTGAELGVAVKATVTITFAGLKQGLFINVARAMTGEIVLDDLSIPKELLMKAEHSAELLKWEDIKPLLPRRARDAHKGDYGHVLVIGGDYGMGGAVRMAAEAAMRMGAGLVTVATRPEHVSIVSGMRPEVMCHRCCGREELLALLEHATTIVIGPGLGKTEWAKELLDLVLESDLPKVLDADALNLLSQAPQHSKRWILTPHPGEAARLLQCGSGDIQSNRFDAARELQYRYDGVIVLKGSGTIIHGAGAIPYLCDSGNPGMATAGMGDILSGMIGALLAQGLSLERAAEAAVFIHAQAGDRAAHQQGERGMLATDVLNYLPELINPYMQLGS